MGYVRAHADHVEVFGGEKLDVGGEVVGGLSGQARHHAAPHLIAAAPERPQAVAPPFPRMVGGMQFRVEPGI